MNHQSRFDTGSLGLVHWDDPEGWYGEGGGKVLCTLFHPDEVLLLAAAEHTGHADHLVRVVIGAVNFETLGVERVEQEIDSFVVFFLVGGTDADPSLHGVCTRVDQCHAGQVQCLVVGELLGKRNLGVN